MESMPTPAWLRLLLLYGHLLLCVYALHAVLHTDWRVLRQRIGRRALMQVHRRISQALAGLRMSGLAIVAIDLWPNLWLATQQPKLLAKLAAVGTLTLNAIVLSRYALPRLAARRPLLRLELLVLAIVGAISTGSWLVAAFIGVARPMAHWTLGQALGLYALALLGAAALALAIGPRALQVRQVAMPTVLPDSLPAEEPLPQRADLAA
jgi:DNA-directed RNA polymerase subunit K/omega